MELQQPFSPAGVAARAWGVESVNSYHATGYQPRRPDDITLRVRKSDPATDNDVFWDPRFQTSKMPLLTSCDEVQTLPGFRHGASAYEAGPPIDRPQYSLGDAALVMSPVTMDIRTLPCMCSALPYQIDILNFSIGASVFDIPNALRVRTLMQRSGMILPSNALLSHVPACVCAVFGDEDSFTEGLFATATNYGSEPMVRVLDPAQTILEINYAHVRAALGNVRELVNSGLKFQYASKMGPAAYLTPYADTPIPARVANDGACEGYVEEQYRPITYSAAARECYLKKTGLKTK